MDLFRWFRKQPPPRAPLAPPDANLDQALAALAALRNEPAIQERAHEIPQLFGPENIPELRRRFDNLPEPPPGFTAREPSACAWITCCHLAMYEALFQYREHALPGLREMAFNSHDPRAIILLCRLAAEGVDRRRTVADLTSGMPGLPGEVRLGVAEWLLGAARKSATITAVVEELQQSPEFEQALAEAARFGDE